MFLQKLSEFYDDLPETLPELYVRTPVRYVVALDVAGGLRSRELTDTSDPSQKAAKRGQPRDVPSIQRTVGIKAILLADKADYTFGYTADPAKAKRTADAHTAYVDLVRRCAAATGEPAVQAVLSFLEDEPLQQVRLPADFDPGGLTTFTVDGEAVVDLPTVQAFWRTFNDPESQAEEGNAPIVMQCLICGQAKPVMRRLQSKLKRIPGGQTSGVALISANADAFFSYGLENSLIAPTCANCGERFSKSLNYLLASEEHRIIMGGMAFIAWTRRKVGFNFITHMTDPQQEEVLALINSVRSGQPQPGVDDVQFYATVLSGSGGRAVVRDWIDTTVGRVKVQVARWFEGQRMVDYENVVGPPLKLYALAAATVRDASKELSPPLLRTLLRSALTGTPLPYDVLVRLTRRNSAEQTVTRPRAALTKLVLAMNKDLKEYDMTTLEPDFPDPAYHYGRLFAVLERAQEQAIPGIKATIADRYFGTASTAPLLVLPRLLRGGQAHLSKLRRDRPNSYGPLQRDIEQICQQLPAKENFAPMLDPREQGLFALGYYHQRAHTREQVRLAAERRRAAGEAAPDDETEEQV